MMPWAIVGLCAQLWAAAPEPTAPEPAAPEPTTPEPTAPEPTAPEPTDPVQVQIDWQAHPAMHIPWKMFGRGLTDRPLRHRSWRHQFRQTVSAPTLAASGVRIFLAAAMAAERARNPRQARRLILRQLAYVEAFVAAHPDDYVLARTPAQARAALASSDKMVIIHSIEGGHHLLWEEADARFWADQGVALITLIHLRDREHGGAAILDQAVGPLINRRGARARRKGEPRGLSAHGRRTIVALDAAGILVDYSHMSPQTLADALVVSAEHQIPPVLTHSRLHKLDPGEFGIRDAQLIEIYRLGGVLSLGLSPLGLAPDGVSLRIPGDLCWETLELWAWQHQLVQQTLHAGLGTIFGDDTLTLDTLTEDQRTRLATGWSSDWNGWVSHSRPVYGPDSCRPDPRELLEIDTRGLAHPGLLPQHWQRVQEQGVDLEPMLRSAERFLQLWEQARNDAPPTGSTPGGAPGSPAQPDPPARPSASGQPDGEDPALR